MAGTAVISTIKHDVSGVAPTFRDGAGNEIGQLCKGWLNFNGATPAVTAGFNISTVTRTSTGVFTPSFSVSLSDANYVASYGGGGAAASSGDTIAEESYSTYYVKTTSSYSYTLTTSAFAGANRVNAYVMIFR